MKSLPDLKLVALAPLAVFISLFSILTVVPQPAYALRCDCSSDAQCGEGRTCDEGSSAACDVYQGNTGLCKSIAAESKEKSPAEKVTSVQVGPWDIPTDTAGLASAVLSIGTGIGTLLAILVLTIGGFGVATSAGDPDKLEKARSQITAAIAGLLFILLAGLILRTLGGIIGIDITLFGI